MYVLIVIFNIIFVLKIIFYNKITANLSDEVYFRKEKKNINIVLFSRPIADFPNDV